MPIIKNTPLNKQCKLILWEITEEVDQLINKVTLTNQEEQKLAKISNPTRKKEFLATRLMVQTMLGEKVGITHNSQGKPILINSSWDISITHTKKIVGIILGKGHNMALDIEYLSERVEKVTSKFLSTKEQENISSKDRLLHLYQYWCAKECLIKLMGRKDLHLTTELQINPFTPHQESFTGVVHGKTFHFKHQMVNNYLLVWCCQPAKS